jgi:3'-5' exonuclease
MNILAFDIETIPDTRAGRLLHDFTDLADKDVAEAMFTRRRQETQGRDFLKYHCQQVVAISVVLRQHDQFKVWSLGEIDSNEQTIIQRFFQGIEKHTPTLVSWNGSGFDLPVLHYRALINNIVAPRYFETGEFEQSFRWNNYLNRFHDRHLDLMDTLAGYQSRAYVSLHEMATLLGLPGKFSLTGGDVWEQYQAGHFQEIRDYCESDALTTYLIFLRFQYLRGALSKHQLDAENDQVREFLSRQKSEHWQQFHKVWSKNLGKLADL